MLVLAVIAAHASINDSTNFTSQCLFKEAHLIAIVPPCSKEKVFCVVHIDRAYWTILEFLKALTHFFIELRRECHYHISNWLERGASLSRSSLERYLFLSIFFLKGRKLYALPPSRLHQTLTSPYYYGKDYPPTPISSQFAACRHQRNYVERDYYKRRQEPNTNRVNRERRAYRALH